MKKALVFLLLCCFGLHGAVYDCFTFFNELELLQMRLAELDDVVDYFVIVEGSTSYTGKPKPLFLAANINEFEKYKDKIIHIVLDKFPEPKGDRSKDHWEREIFSRNCFMRGLKHCHSDDIILISDVDEIPRKETLMEVKEYLWSLAVEREQGHFVRDNAYVCEFDMIFLAFYLNCEWKQFRWVGGCKAVPYWFLTQHAPWEIKIYHHIHSDTQKFANGGWHFHAMGGVERCIQKWLNTMPEEECRDILRGIEKDNRFMEKHIQSEINSQLRIVPIDESYPKYMMENLDYFISLGWIFGED